MVLGCSIPTETGSDFAPERYLRLPGIGVAMLGRGGIEFERSGNTSFAKDLGLTVEARPGSYRSCSASGLRFQGEDPRRGRRRSAMPIPIRGRVPVKPGGSGAQEMGVVRSRRRSGESPAGLVDVGGSFPGG